MAETPRPWPVVCAIDFGTTYSGYAYSMRTEYERDPLKIETNPLWTNDGPGTLKTPTCILFDKLGNFHSFGYEAERKYITIAESTQHNNEDDEDDESGDDDDDDDDSETAGVQTVKEEDNVNDWLYFRRFKMKLFQDTWMRAPKLTKLKLTAENGVKMPALEIFSEAIKYLKHHFENLLENSMLSHDGGRPAVKVTEDRKSSWSSDILWVLTVPAIWSDQAKQFMREAAIQAGIKDEQLLLALEPECAALLCKHLALTKKADECNVRTFDPDSKFMVVDCGGGTVDVTAYVVNENRSLRELHCATGGAVGGTNVDNLFFDLLGKIFGKTVLQIFQKNSPSDYQEILKSFEIKKRSFGMETNSNKSKKAKMVTFSYLGDLFSAFAETGKTVSQQLKELGLNKKINATKNAKLRLDESFLIGEVLEGPIEDIVKHLQDLFRTSNVSEIDTVLLVGGFSECPLLQKAIKEAFPGKNVINPRDGSAAVLKGAVLFGHSPESLSKKLLELGYPAQKLELSSESFIRKSRAFYGVATDVLFDKEKHPPENLVLNDGIMMCSDVFDCLIKKNQSLEGGKTVIEKTFRASSSNFAKIEIYRSEDEVEYCHGDGCKKIGEISAYDEESIDKMLFSVQLHFGFTEKIVIAKDLSTNKTWKAKLNCLL